MLQDPLAIVAILFVVIWISLKLVDRYRWAEKLSDVMLILFLGAVASNTGLIPTDAPIYSDLVDFSVPFAVCVILFKVNLADLKNACKAMIVAYISAVIGTFVGVVVADWLLDPFLQRILGENAWKLAGPYTGTYIGGSLNFFALWTGLEINDPDLFAAANAVDNLSLLPLFAIWFIVPPWLGKTYTPAPQWAIPASTSSEAQVEQKPDFIPTQIVTLIVAALLVMWASEWIKETWIHPIFPQVPTILIITTLALLLGQLKAINQLDGAWELGFLAFYVFFSAVGALINLYNAVLLAPILFLYVMIIIAIHMVLIYGGGRFLRMDIRVLTIASVAAKSGPPMVLAFAKDKDWRALAVPGVIMGLFGYAIGNYIGFGAAYLMKWLLIG